MSDLSSLSHEYAESASFADEINTSVLRLKKALMGTSSAQDLGPEELQEARRKLMEALEGLLAELSPDEEVPQREEITGGLIPEEVVERVSSKHRNRLPYFIKDIQRGIQSLRSGESLEAVVFGIADDLCDVADATASLAFRRLWRR